MTFFRFCKGEQYARDFLDGRVHLTRLCIFQQMEEAQLGGTGDSHEGALAHYSATDLRFVVDGLPNFSMVMRSPAPSVVLSEHVLGMFALCFAATRGDGWLDAGWRKPGFAVQVTDVGAFTARFKAACSERGCRSYNAAVHYYHTRPGGRACDAQLVGFNKRTEFAWQSEYRFLVDDPHVENDRWFLDVGSLRDVARLVSSETLRPIEAQP